MTAQPKYSSRFLSRRHRSQNRTRRDSRPLGAGFESLEARQVLSVTFSPIGGYETGIFNDGAAEGVSYSVAAQRLFVANQSFVPATATTPAMGPRIDVVDASDPHSPTLEFSIDVSSYGLPTSVATRENLVAVAIPNGADETQPGVVLFFDAHANSTTPLKVVEVGPVPDHVVFTPDGTKVLTANEGQDGGTFDPEGSISVIDISQGVDQATESKITFTAYNDKQKLLLAQGVRFLPDRNVAQSFEPEYIAVHPNSQLAWVTLQENNAIARINLQTQQVTWVKGLGYKDFSAPGNGFDPSDRDGGIHIGNWPVLGAYEPDGITVFSDGSDLYLATANEGDGFGGESSRVSTLNLDDATFPNEAALKTNAQLGRLNVSNLFGDTDGDGDVDKLYAFGARSFSIWTPGGDQVFDSGDDFEQITAAAYPANFNASNTNNTRDDRSDDRGPEPTTVVVGEVEGRKYAFVTVERTGGIMVYDVTVPAASTFVQYVNTRNFSQTPGPGTGGDLHPENLQLVSPSDSPTGNMLLVVSYQVSGSVRIFEITPSASAAAPSPASPASAVATIATAQVPGNSSQTATNSQPVNSHVALRTARLRKRDLLQHDANANATDRALSELTQELTGGLRRRASWHKQHGSVDGCESLGSPLADKILSLGH
jgi:hypothetical protein